MAINSNQNRYTWDTPRELSREPYPGDHFVQLSRVNLPTLITLSGVDDAVSLDSMDELSTLYNVEWGVLAHPDKHGQQRYPSRHFLLEFADHVQARNAGDTADFIHSMQGSLHLCGGYIDAFMEAGYCGLEHVLHGFQKVQFNLGDIPLTVELAESINSWANNYRKEVIIQVKEWPDKVPHARFGYLLDRSRGKGILADTWPCAYQLVSLVDHLFGRTANVSYAGGITPENVKEVIWRITRNGDMRYVRYGIDLETGLRDEHGEFSLAKAHSICETVYQKRVMYDGRAILATDVEYYENETRRNIERAADLERRRYVAMAVFADAPDETEWQDDEGTWWLQLEDGRVVYDGEDYGDQDGDGDNEED